MSAARIVSGQLHVLVVLYYYRPYISGLSEYARRLAEGLARRGHRVTVLTTAFEPGLARREQVNGVDVIRMPVLARVGKGVVSPALVGAAIALARSHDRVQLHLPLPDAGLIAPWVDAGKLVITYHCDINLGPGLANRAIEKASLALMGVAMRRAPVIVGNSRRYFAHSAFARHLARFHQIYPPIPTGDFSRQKDPDFWSRFSIPAEGPKIGFVGRIVYEKGLNYLLRSVPLIRRSVPGSLVVIAGDDRVAGGGIRHALEGYRERYPGAIFFTGRLSDVDLVTFYSEIDVLVLPSIDPLESFGMVQIEAMCCGTPVVASRMPGVEEAVLKTGFGRLARPRDADDLADQIIRVLAGDFSSDAFSPEDWDLERCIDAYEALLGRSSNDVQGRLRGPPAGPRSPAPR